LFSDSASEPQELFATLFQPQSLFTRLFKPKTSSFNIAQNLFRSTASGTRTTSAATWDKIDNAEEGSRPLGQASIGEIAVVNAENGVPILDGRGYKISQATRNQVQAQIDALIALGSQAATMSPAEATQISQQLVSQLEAIDPVYWLLVSSSASAVSLDTLAAGIIEMATTRRELNDALAVLDGQFEAPAPTPVEQGEALVEAQTLTIALGENPAEIELPQLDAPEELSAFTVYDATARSQQPATDGNQSPFAPLTLDTMGAILPLSISA
jgi:hypothetical protein